MFVKLYEVINGRAAIAVSQLGDYSLYDTLECGQAFRYELIEKKDDYIEYITVVGDTLINVAQRTVGELIFYDMDDEVFERVAVPYFSLTTDYGEIKKAITSATDSEWMLRAAECAKGIAILKQDEWEALFSFIVSQNNNIPRIRKILRAICRVYGKNLAEGRLTKCPKALHGEAPCDSSCGECGICYSFPTPGDIVNAPEKLLPSKPGFRYKYLVAAAEAVSSGEVDLKKISAAKSYGHTVEELKRIKGVGDKVAACTALFGFANLEAFPIDVWMKKAINDYFGGHLDPKIFGAHAGVAQQYIFHYIRNLEGQEA